MPSCECDTFDWRQAHVNGMKWVSGVSVLGAIKFMLWMKHPTHTHTHTHEDRLYLSVAAVNPRLSCRRIRQRHLTDNWKRVNKLTSFVESLRRRAFTLFSKRATERSYKDYWAILPAALKYFRRRKVDFLVCEKCKWFILNNAL